MKVIVQDILKMANAFGFIGFNFILRTLKGMLMVLLNFVLI